MRASSPTDYVCAWRFRRGPRRGETWVGPTVMRPPHYRRVTPTYLKKGNRRVTGPEDQRTTARAGPSAARAALPAEQGLGPGHRTGPRIAFPDVGGHRPGRSGGLLAHRHLARRRIAVRPPAGAPADPRACSAHAVRRAARPADAVPPGPPIVPPGQAKPHQDNGNHTGQIKPHQNNGNHTGQTKPHQNNGNHTGQTEPHDNNGNHTGQTEPHDNNGNHTGLTKPPKDKDDDTGPGSRQGGGQANGNRS